VLTLTINASGVIISIWTRRERVMHVFSTKDTSRFPFAVLAYVADSVTKEANFDFRYIWKDLVLITTKKNIFRKNLTNKLKTDST